MKKNQVLLSLLALNSVCGISSEASAIQKINKKIIYNLEKGEKLDNQYKIINDILIKRNKELKDLYKQSDYIVKPEYLEWQVFFTGFYDYVNKGGDRKDNPKKIERNLKSINLGMVIPVKEIKRNDLNLNMTSLDEPKIDVNINLIEAPQISVTGTSYAEIGFPVVPKALTLPVNGQNSLRARRIGERKDAIKYNLSGTTIFDNLNTISNNKTSLLFDTKTNNISIAGDVSYSNGAVTGTTNSAYIHTGYGSTITGTSINNIANDGNFEVKGNWNMTVVDHAYNNDLSFLSYLPYNSNQDSKVLFSGNLELITNSTTTSTTASSLIGLSMNLSHLNADPATKAVLENSGDIVIRNGNSRHQRTIGMQLVGAGGVNKNTQAGELINSGNIIIESSVDIQGQVGSAGILVSIEPIIKPVLVKPGNIQVQGKGNNAIVIGQENTAKDYVDSNITIDGSGGKIILEGLRNGGIFVGRAVTSTGGSLLDNVKNMNILINGTNTPAITRHTENPIEKTMDMKLNDTVFQSVEFGENSVQSSLVQAGISNIVSTNSVILESSLENALVPINAGRQNAIAAGNISSLIINHMPITINPGAKAMIGIISEGSFENYGNIINNSSVYEYSPTVNYGGVGLALYKYAPNSQAINKGTIDMNGDYAVGIYNLGINFSSDSDHIIVNGKNGIGVYAGTSHPNYYSEAYINADSLEVNGDNSTLLFSNGGNINVGSHTSGQAMKLTASGKDTFAFFVQKYYNLFGKFRMTGDVNLSLKNGAIGFYYKGTGSSDIMDIPLYLNTLVDTANGNLIVTSDDKSYNMAIENTGVRLSDLSDIKGDKIEFTGAKKAKLNRSRLIMDTDSNIDINNTTGDKTYRDLELSKSGVSILEGVTLSGTENNQIGIGQSYSYSDSVSSYINSENAGTINLSGNSSAGMYSRRSELINKGKIDMSGSQSTGMYIKSGTLTNNGEITVGDQGVGMFGETYLEPEDNPSSQSSSISINNSGKITAKAGNKAIGIYGNQNAVPGTNSNGKITLLSGTDIDTSASKSGVGIYSNGIKVAGSGNTKITVGENGTGLYIKNSDADFSDLELNLKGNNSVGIFTDGDASFTGTGNINVDGKGIVIFNIAGTGSFNENFNINSTEGSKYIIQNIQDRTLYYNSSANLGGGGTFVSGLNSGVLLGENSILSSGESNLVGIALKGNYINGLPMVINGETLDHEATNNGKIDFKDNSIGIYVIDGASGVNNGEILLGKNSVGLYGSGTNVNIKNTGKINIGENSVGLYNKDGNEISNSGNIESLDSGVVGIYLDGNSNSTALNTGTISLFGNKSVGIYMSENGVKRVDNSNYIIIGDSFSAEDPSVGIYNNNVNGIVNNTSDIKSGKNSINIYNKGGKVNHSLGTIDVGEKGTGIYTNSGNLTLTNSLLNLNGTETVGIYGTNNAIIDIDANINVNRGNYGIVLNGRSELTNRNISILGDKGVLLYSDGDVNVKNELGANVNMTGSGSAGFYMKNGGNLTNKAEIIANSGVGNIGIYNKLGNIDNSGNIKIGDSLIIDPENPYANEYAVGIYGDSVENIKNTGNIEIGANAVGYYVSGNQNEALNTGNISSNFDGAIGIYSEQGSVVNKGNIMLSGNKSIGIAAARNSKISNFGVITMGGNENIGIYAHANSKIINENTGKIYINGNNSTGVQLSDGSVLENYGIIEVAKGTIGSTEIKTGSEAYTPPSIINAGIIKVDEKFELDGFNLLIKPDPESFRIPTMEELIENNYSLDDINGGFLLSNTVNITAPSFDFGNNPVGIDPLFTQGTNARVYKFENVFDPKTPEGGPNTGELTVKSGSLTFDAIPVTNEKGKIDIWMEKIDYSEFTKGAWNDDFAKNIEENYLNAKGDALKLYDKIDLIENETDFSHVMDSLAGNIYSNMNQRQEDISRAFDSSLHLLENSKNNTKENVKINVIVGKGRTKEDTEGVTDYDYTTTGVLALREVERTYRHTFGYSLGYLHTGFEFKDGNESEEWVDTIQLGLHNKYDINNWILKNNITGRVSIHNIDRNIDWPSSGRSELNGSYETYSISSDNRLGRELSLGKNMNITAYGGIKATYITRPSFKEKGLEALEVEGNDAWSVKPRTGIELKGTLPVDRSGTWHLKGTLDVSYEYELANINERERTKLTNIENNYHDLSKPEKEKGSIRTKAEIGVETEDRYGIFITGEYRLNDNGQNKGDYRAGVVLKAVF